MYARLGGVGAVVPVQLRSRRGGGLHEAVRCGLVKEAVWMVVLEE